MRRFAYTRTTRPTFTTSTETLKIDDADAVMNLSPSLSRPTDSERGDLPPNLSFPCFVNSNVSQIDFLLFIRFVYRLL